MIRIVLSLIALVALVGSCSSPVDTVASGAQDFPNSLTATVSLFLRMAGNFTEFDQIERVQRGIPRQSDLAGVQPPEDTSLQKGSQARRVYNTATGSDTTWWDLADSSSGTVRRFRHITGEHFTQKDTLWILYTPQVYDTIDSNEIILKQNQYLHWPYLRISIHYSAVNADSNRFFEHRQTRYEVPAANGQVNTTTVFERPGPDSSFIVWDDNWVDSIRVLEAINGDTLRYNVVSDVEGDGVLWIHGIADSFVTDIHSIFFVDSTQPSLIRGELTARMLLDPWDLGNSFPMRFAADYRYENGRTAATSLNAHTADSVITPGDTVVLTVAWYYPQPDTVESLFVAFIAQLDSTPLQPDAANYWSRFTGRLTARNGAIESANCSFMPEYPVHQLDSVFKGTFAMSATLVSGENRQLKGTLTEGFLEGVFTDEAGKQYTVRITRQ